MTRRAGIGAILLSCLPAAWPSPAAPHGSSLLSAPVVQVLVLFDPLLGYEGTVTYAVPVDRAQARAELAELAKRLGYSGLDELRPFDRASGKRSGLRFRAVKGGAELTFKLSEAALGRDDGTIPLEPYIATYRAYRRINLEFYVSDLNGRAFAYRGPGDFENRWIRMAHQGQAGYQAFQIEVLDPGFRSLELPPFAPPEVPLGSDANPSTPRGDALARRLAGAVVLGLGLSLLVYLALFGWLTRRRAPTAPRRRRWHR